jgi:hypothetical protein
MSTLWQNLTEDEQTLHHRVAMLKRKLDEYHACEPRDEVTWRDEFKVLMVRRHLFNCNRKSAKFISLLERIVEHFSRGKN